MRTSFLIPVYNPDLSVLRLCVNSTLKAAGDEHEVIIVDDASSRDETREFLSRCAASGLDNLKVLRNAENSGVSYSLNKAADNATGVLYAPVDHDDMLVTHGFQYMLRYQNYYGINWAYSDETQINYKGIPVNFMHKPQYDAQLLRSVMYINHLQLIPSELFETVAGYREGFEGSQDHDLALRMSEHIAPNHVNTVAYLWRRNDETQSVTYGRIGDISIEASRCALQEHFDRLGLNATVRPYQLRPSHELPPQPTGTFISRILPPSIPKLSIIIPCKLGTLTKVNKKTIVVLEHCLQSIRSSLREVDKATLESPETEIILVLNHEDDVELADQLITKFDLNGFSVCDEKGFDFARKCNLGAESASGEILVFLNDDTDIQTEGWTSHVICLLQEDDVACVGGMLLNENRTVQSCGDNVGRSSAVHYAPSVSASSVGDSMHRYIADHETTSVTGAFFCCRKSTFKMLGGFSTVFPNSFQDVDYCLRARARNMRCITSPHVRLLHFESASRNPQVDAQTLSTIREFHSAIIGPPDPFSLWAYERPTVPIFTLTGVRYYLGLIRRILRRSAFILLVSLAKGPQSPRLVLNKHEWRVH